MYLKIQGFYHIIVNSFCMKDSGVARKVLKGTNPLEIKICIGNYYSKVLKCNEKNSKPPSKNVYLAMPIMED